MVSRRAVLAGGAAATAATAVGGCSTYGTPSATPAKTSHGPVSLGPVSEIPVGGGKVFASHQVVVTQPKHGEIKCFTAVCTHEGCLVDSVTSGLINCPCHGSQYNMATGKVVRGPAPRALAPETITVTDGNITLA